MIVEDLLRRQAGILNLSLADITDAGETETLFLGYASSAQRELERYADWPWLYARGAVATTSGQPEASLPSDFAAFLWDDVPYYAAGAYALAHASRAAISLLRGQGSASGRPTHYNLAYSGATRRWQFTFWPTPAAIYTITLPYRRRLADFTARSQTPQIPDELQEVLALLATAVTEEQHERMAEGTQRAKAQAALEAAWRTFGSPVRDQARIRLRNVVDQHEPSIGPEGGPILINVTAP